MLRPARMVHLNVLVMDSDVDRATTQMIKSGLVHLVRVTDLEPWAEETGMKTVEAEEPADVAQVETMARSLAEKLGVAHAPVSERLALESFDPKETTTNLQEISAEVNALVARRDAAADTLASLRQMTSQAQQDLRQTFGVQVPSRYTLLETALGRLPERSIEPLKRLLAGVPNVILTIPEEKGKFAVMAIVMKKDRSVLLKATDEVGLERMPVEEGKVPVSAEIMQELEERITKAREDLDGARAALDQCRNTHLATLQKILSQLSFHNLTRTAKSRFRKTTRTYLISGWTPRHERDRVVTALKEACENRCLVEEHSAEELLAQRGDAVDVPILFENPHVLKPFEMLVSSYGPPAYNSIDPTLVVAPTFLLMYGAMFGDVGQGAVVAVLGALVGRWRRVSQGVRRIGQLFTWCGCSAILFGFLYGSVFGFKNLFPYRGFEPVENVGAFLTFALYFGMGLISLGLLFNAVVAIRKREWATALFDRTGLMGLAFYWLAVAIVIRVFAELGLGRTLVPLLIAVPAGAALLKEPLERLTQARGRHVPYRVGAYLSRTLGHILGAYFENAIMFLSNTLSFLRLAAFAIAHGALFIAVFTLADVLRGGGAALPVLIHIVGNAGMIALEGLVVCVQALRLEYYEFFGKFYRVGATEFTPVKLPSTIP